MGVGGGGGIDTFFRCIGYHVQEGGVQIGFALEIKDQVKEISGHLIDGIPEKIILQHACRPGKGAQTAGALRAAQVTGGGGLEGYRNRIAPLDGFAGEFAQIVATEDLHAIPQAPGRELG